MWCANQEILMMIRDHFIRPSCIDAISSRLTSSSKKSASNLKKRDPEKREAKQDLRSLCTQFDVRILQPVKGFSTFR